MAIDIYLTFENDTDITPDAYVALRGLKGDKGDPGPNGNDGVGINDITYNLDGSLTIVLSDGTTYDTEPLKGEDGQDGVDGQDGADGNGIASAILNNDYTLTLTFTDGTTYTTPSIRGAQGIQGDKGNTGDDGFSPVVEVEEITGGHTITITDAEGDHSFNVMDGSGYTETDPTVPSWAKASSKPSYTASEVGALPSSTVIPSALSDLTNDMDVSDFPNDAGYLTSYTETGVIAFDTTATSGTDYDLTAILTSLGWLSDVIE